MGEIFLNVLNRSIAAGWLILAVMLLRLLLKKAPKFITVALWGIVALRLVVPFSFESTLSLLPCAETIPEKVMSGPGFDVQTGIASVDNRINDYLGSHYFEGVTVPANNGANTMATLSTLWAIGIVFLIIYAAIGYVRVRRSVAERVPYGGDIFLCDRVKSPFILGLLRPKVYLPSDMDAAAVEPVIAHEKAHLARRDHWWKPLGFVILTIYWFNPLCWAAFVLLCRDIELACDEKVIRQLDMEGKKRYSAALLACSIGRRTVSVCPLAFGEVGVRERIKSVLRYKKPAFWVAAAAVAACAAVAVCFATNPASAESSIRLQSTHSAPPAAFFSLDLADEVHGTVIAERWENGRCVSANPVFMNNAAQQIQLYLDPQDNGVNVQLGVDNGDTVLETFSYPEGKKPVGWAFTSLEEGKKASLSLGNEQIIFAMAFDFGEGVRSYSCDALTADEKQVEDAAYIIVIRVFLANSDAPADISNAVEQGPDGGGHAANQPDFSALSAEQSAIYGAIMEHNRSPYPQEYDVACCSFVPLEILSAAPEAGSDGCEITYYGWALYSEYRVTDSGLQTVGGSHVPAAISFDADEDGYVLREYWQPRDGDFFEQDIRDRFPARIVEDALDSERFILPQMQACYEQAAAFSGQDTDRVIGALVETICGSPALSSDLGDYIEEHPAEFRELVCYGRFTLRYCFARFETGEESGLPGCIMARVCGEIAASLGEEPLVFNLPAGGTLTGREWYGAFKDNALRLKAQYGEEELAARYPASCLLLEMLGEV